MKLIIANFLFLSIISAISEDLGPISKLEYMPAIKEVRESGLETDVILGNIEKTLKPITSLQYIVEKNTPQDPVYERLEWKEEKEKFFWYLFSTGKDGVTVLELVSSFDGTVASYFNKLAGDILVSDKPFDLVVPQAYDTPLVFFQFVKTDNEKVRLIDLTTDALKKLKDRMTILGKVLVDGKICLAIRCSGSYDSQISEKVDYDVFFDADTFLPIGWNAYDSSHVLYKKLRISHLVSTEFEAGERKLPLVSNASLWQSKFSGSINDASGKQIEYYGTERNIDFSKIVVNLEDLDFFIDPSSANAIHDVNKDVWIKVPR